MKRKKAKTGKNERAVPDYYARRAKKEHFPARSVYKLSEIQNKYRVLKPGGTVVDLGCAPGSWLRYAADVVGDSGCVIGIDPKGADIAISANMFIFQEDINELSFDAWRVIDRGVDAVLSDMAPATTGRKDVDAARSEQLCEMALYVADRALLTDGVFVCKIFQGGGFKAFSESVRVRFEKMKIYKPASCRKDSREIYIIGTGKKQEE
ncbi:MAG: RlmE family RNA methyltransferase [Desulfobacteraceae bacterium]|nr:RlmE family RNA methyltransferase [Desulfobacteraceae bacterium]